MPKVHNIAYVTCWRRAPGLFWQIWEAILMHLTKVWSWNAPWDLTTARGSLCPSSGGQCVRCQVCGWQWMWPVSTLWVAMEKPEIWLSPPSDIVNQTSFIVTPHHHRQRNIFHLVRGGSDKIYLSLVKPMEQHHNNYLIIIIIIVRIRTWDVLKGKYYAGHPASLIFWAYCWLGNRM